MTIARRTWFPIALLAVVAVGFVSFGPPAAGAPDARLQQMAPAGAGSGAYEAPAGASATEIEIAKRYETLRRAPDTIAAYVLLGSAYLQHVREVGDPADYGRAQAAFEEASAREPENVDALIGLGTLALARHQFSSGLTLGQRAVALAPASSRAQGVVVDALTELGRYDEAVDSAQRMVDLRPDLASLTRIAYQRELHGDIDGAIEAMIRAFDAAAGAVAENREFIRVLIGDLFLLKGDRVTAAHVYAATLSVMPDAAGAHLGLARVALANGNTPAALDDYRQATQTRPTPEALVAQGEAQEAAGLIEDAFTTYGLARAAYGREADNGVNVGLVLAVLEANHGDLNAAIDLARRAYATQPTVKAADALAWALYKTGRIDESAGFSAEALRLGSPYASFAFHAGMIALAQGRSADGQALLGRAIAHASTLSPLDLASAQAAVASPGN